MPVDQTLFADLGDPISQISERQDYDWPDWPATAWWIAAADNFRFNTNDDSILDYHVTKVYASFIITRSTQCVNPSDHWNGIYVTMYNNIQHDDNVWVWDYNPNQWWLDQPQWWSYRIYDIDRYKDLTPKNQSFEWTAHSPPDAKGLSGYQWKSPCEQCAPPCINSDTESRVNTRVNICNDPNQPPMANNVRSINVTLDTGVSYHQDNLSLQDNWKVTHNPDGEVEPPKQVIILETVSPSWFTIPYTKWISTEESEKIGDYTYQLCFCLDVRFRNAKITLDLRASDSARVILNGTQIGEIGSQSFSFLYPIRIESKDQSLFQIGVNCIQIIVNNSQYGTSGLDIKGRITDDAGYCGTEESLMYIRYATINELTLTDLGKKDIIPTNTHFASCSVWRVEIPISVYLNKNTQYWMSLIVRADAPPVWGWCLSSALNSTPRSPAYVQFGPNTMCCNSRIDGNSGEGLIPAGTYRNLNFQLDGRERRCL